MERTFKKITEGIEEFDNLYYRHENAANSSQKEKLEGDLKKEIKKLQRLREQIKNWQSTGETKDEDRLIEHRKLVEHAMEQYKVVEKGSKLKAYSDQSLMNLSASLDPEDEEKIQATEFLESAIERLRRQDEQLEGELDRFSIKKKKISFAEEERKTEIQDLMEKHSWHSSKLENALRNLQNGLLEAYAIMELKDDIDYYLDSNQDPDFMEDDAIYDSLHLGGEEKELSYQEEEEEEEEEPTEILKQSDKDILEEPEREFKKEAPREELKAQVQQEFSTLPPEESSTPVISKPSLIVTGLPSHESPVVSLKPASNPGEVNWSALTTKKECILTPPAEPRDDAEVDAPPIPPRFVEDDRNLVVLPPGLQDFIVSWHSNPEPIDSVNSLLRTPLPFYPGSYPSPPDAQRVENLWNNVRCSGALESLVGKLDLGTLFYALYYAKTPIERLIAQRTLVERNWEKLSEGLWMQKMAVKFQSQFLILADFKVFESSCWSVKDKLNHVLDTSSGTGMLRPVTDEELLAMQAQLLQQQGFV